MNKGRKSLQRYVNYAQHPTALRNERYMPRQERKALGRLAALWRLAIASIFSFLLVR